MAETSGGNEGFVLGLRPRRYKRTPQQVIIAEANRACGIEKGISREALVKAMKECIPVYLHEHRKQQEEQQQRAKETSNENP